MQHFRPLTHCQCGCIYNESTCPNCNYVKPYRLEFGVEYYPNPEEGPQFEEVTESQLLDLIAQHNARGLNARLEYERFTLSENGRDGRRLTLVDEWGIFYG